MNIFLLAWAYIRHKPLNTLLNILLLTFGLGSLIFLNLTEQQFKKTLQRDAKPIDMVVGAKGSGLQMVLAGVYHLDKPTGNIPFSNYQELKNNRLIKKVVPLSLGDNYRGFRIVGTDVGYMELYQAKLAQGKLWQHKMEVVLGSQVARSNSDDSLKVGSTFTASHGLSGDGAAHKDLYTVTGILAPTGTVLDRLILTSLDSVWFIHEGTPSDAEEKKQLEENREITLALIQATPIAALTLPKQINADSNLQAARPAEEIARLLEIFSVNLTLLQGFAWLLLVSASLSLFIGLTQALQERRYDLSILRLLGANRIKLVSILLCETLLIASLGVLGALLFGHGLNSALKLWLNARDGTQLSSVAFSIEEIKLIMIGYACAFLAVLYPVWQVRRADIALILAEN